MNRIERYARIAFCLAAIAGLGLAEPRDAEAQSCMEQLHGRLADPGSYESALRRPCIGNENDRDGNDLVAPVLDAIPPADDNAVERRAGVSEALQILIRAAERRETSSSVRTQWRMLAERLQREHATLAGVGADSDVDMEGFFMSRSDFDPTVTGTAVVLGDFAVYRGVDDACPEIEPGDVSDAVRNCIAFTERIDLLRALRLSENIAAYSTDQSLVTHARDAALALERWDAYWNDARFQWWWEVGINGRLMEKQGLCRTNVDSVRIGFCDVPSSQWIVLHPDVAFQWIDGAESTSELHVSGIVEVIGRNRWRWDGATMTKAFGWSLVASYTKLSGQGDWGYGGMIHWRNRFSLGITDTDGELGVFINANLSDLLFARKAKYQQYLRELEKADLMSLVFGVE